MKYLNIILATGTMLSLFSCGQAPPRTNTVEKPIIINPAMGVPVEHIKATADQQRRRAASEKICAAHGIPVYSNQNALFVDQEDSATIRSKKEVIDRALALCLGYLKSESENQSMLKAFDNRFHVIPRLSPKEKNFILSAHPTQQEMINANWKAEGIHVMLWALGYIDSLSFPNTTCNISKDLDLVFLYTAKQFTDKAKLRTKKEILDQADLILRFDWACNEARIQRQEMPGQLNVEVVLERHLALNWLINYMNQPWDEVSADT
jgi:Domain of unknown function (DUF4272)